MAKDMQRGFGSTTATSAAVGSVTDEKFRPNVRVVVEHVVADAAEIPLQACNHLDVLIPAKLKHNQDVIWN